MERQDVSKAKQSESAEDNVAAKSSSEKDVAILEASVSSERVVVESSSISEKKESVEGTISKEEEEEETLKAKVSIAVDEEKSADELNDKNRDTADNTIKKEEEKNLKAEVVETIDEEHTADELNDKNHETTEDTFSKGEEEEKTIKAEDVEPIDGEESADKLNVKHQEEVDGGQNLLEDLSKVEKDIDVAAKEDLNELTKANEDVIEKNDDQTLEKEKSEIAFEDEKISRVDKPAAEEISNTKKIDDAPQKAETENIHNKEQSIQEISKSRESVGIEISKNEENKNLEKETNTLNTSIDEIEKSEKFKDSTIIETDENESIKYQTKSIPTQAANKEIAKEFKETNNVEGTESESAPEPLECIGKNTEAVKDSNSMTAADVENENQDPTSKSGAVIDVQDEDKTKPDNEFTIDKEQTDSKGTEKQSIDAIAEVIEIDDDDEEMLAKNQNTKTDEDMHKDEASKVAVSTEENQENHCPETSIKTLEDDAVVNTTTSMPIIFYNKECINFECPKNHKEFHRAPQFAMNYFKIVKKKIKVQYICGECYDLALNFYQDLCGMLNAKQPILLRDIASKKQEFVEILDSSDEEDNSTNETENKEKENTSFSKADLILIETELQNAIRNAFERVEIQNQLTWSKTIFTERVQKLQEELEYIDAELREQQNLADKMYNNLYESGKYRISTLKPLDLDNENADQIPPYGEVERPPIKLGELYYAAKHKAIACWIPCRAVEQLDVTQVGLQKNVPNFKVKFINAQYQTYKNLQAKLMAYYDPPSVRLLVGQRVIALFDGSTLSPRDKDKCVVQSAFYPGIIAEEMKPNNFFRYLIFYDDGYTQYVSHKDVRLVCHVARNVWEDVDQSSREFIQKYIMEYRVNRPMVQSHKGQKMSTESNGRWVPARVIDIDCSLVRMQFEGPNKNHKEWIYRGSLRLNPVYMEYQKSKNSQASQMPISRLPRRTEPFIRYTEDEENTCIRDSLGTQHRNVNRFDIPATTSESPKVRHLNANTIYLEDENRPKGKVIYYTAKRQLPTKTYSPHKCRPECLIVVPHNLSGYSPLAKPLLSGWERVFLRQKAKKRVFYRAPCGKAFRDMKEVHQYLRLTKNSLNVDCFDFYTETSCLAEFEAENINLRKRDISNGQEKMPLPLVNYYDDTLPECTYSAKVIPTEGVNINTNPDFLICCDCEDDCLDKEKCACWQLTIEGVRSINPEIQIEDIGYQYKRLYEHLPTGIYECNSRCKCKSHCINRVVQHSLEMKLQVFKTSNRGWGLRCLNDIPRGSFVCIYAGNLLTESKANEGGLDAGDEYFAELDYIETVEQLKEGYESDVEPPEDEEDEEPYLPDDDDDFRPGKSFLNRSKRPQRQSSGEGERQAINFNPKVAMVDNTKKKRPSVRQFFGKDEAVYVMDAKVTGNLGRYFNHSCSPNLFVQNVFVDTHDVRFPWVAFFSSTHIRAGTELTWNYNYEVGVVPGKVLYCQCGAPNCRQRLL